MTLLDNLKIKRALSKKKRPLRPSPFALVIQVVLEHRLGDDFLRKLDDLGLERARSPSPWDSLRPKPALAPRLFPLGSEAEYELTQAILSKVNNPYLFYAYGPEEILLSPSLYRLNPNLKADILGSCHFGILLAYELARQELQDSREPGQNPAYPEEPESETELKSRRARMAELRDFVQRVENHYFKAGD